ncbi:hypothetical protein F511_06349 [Dorcoceras hygrometricum]|uniref:DUF7811 domain-containing protein n=1 Tax=Dorcoceras hygrometricum TaxID=472368 RepID=A0A2Z7B3R0_9LAMI|nr:hypothetical protein F511_06349 [Dorcoceras hygrometricum]
MAESSTLCVSPFPSSVSFCGEPMSLIFSFHSTSLPIRKSPFRFHRHRSSPRRFIARRPRSGYFPDDDDSFGSYPWQNPDSADSSIQWIPEERVTLFTADGLIQIGGKLVPRRVSSSDGLDVGRRLCIVGFCRSVEMLCDVVEDTVLEHGGEVVTAKKASKGGLHEKLTMTVAVPLLWGVPPASDTLHLAVRSGGGIVDKNRRSLYETIASTETRLYSFSPLHLMILAALPGAATVTSVFNPFVELVRSWNLPDWLIHWGHPGNMAVVLFAMGGYGTYLGFRIRFSDNAEEKAMAKTLHPKLLGGMFFFFALGATGGIISLLTSDKSIFESPHAVTGFIGLTLLTVQTILPALFEENPGLRNVHGILGSGIMTLFLVHAALGLQLGLSY